jgi:dolichyl-phosphate-mannose-protein mannosyltransferase
MAGLLAISACLLVFVAMRAAHRLAAPRPDRAWVFIAAITLQLGGIAVLTSVLRRYEPVTFLVCQAILAAAVGLLTRGGPRWAGGDRPLTQLVAWALPPRPPRPPRDWVCLSLLAGIIVILGLTAARQAIMPIWGTDEAGYHAPRILYWMQHRGVYMPQTHDYRQTTFPFGAELFPAWTLLFVKAEWPARMVFWLELPATAVGMTLLCRAIGIGRRGSLAAALLLISTPTVAWHSTSLKSDAWLPLYLCGTVYFALRPRPEGERPGIKFLWAGLFLAMATNVKTTSLGLGPGLALAAAMELRPRVMMRCAGGLACGFLVGAVLSGLAGTLIQNMERYGVKHPLGPPIIQHFVQPEFSVKQVQAHAARLPLFLFEPPEVPSEGIRRWLDRTGNELSASLGADAKLQYEHQPWPGPFRYVIPGLANSYSLGGILWLPVLFGAVAAAVVRLARSWRRPSLPPALQLALMQVPLFLGVVFLIRWMGGGPARFWLGAYAMSVPVTVWAIERWAIRRPMVAAAAAIGLVLAVHPSVRTSIGQVEEAVMRPRPEEVLDAPYGEVTAMLRPGSRILLFCHGQTREYGLFLPRRGFPNQMIPWGMGPFDAAKAEAIIEKQGTTHIFITNEMCGGYNWKPEVTASLLRWAQANKAFMEVPLKTPAMRLFAARGGGAEGAKGGTKAVP